MVQVWVANYAKIFEVWPRTEPSLVKRFVVDTLERSLKEPVRIRPRSHGAAENSRNVLFNTHFNTVQYTFQHCAILFKVHLCSVLFMVMLIHFISVISFNVDFLLLIGSSVSFVQDHASHGCVRSWPQEVSQRSIISMSIPVATDHARRKSSASQPSWQKIQELREKHRKGMKRECKEMSGSIQHISTYFHRFPHYHIFQHDCKMSWDASSTSFQWQLMGMRPQIKGRDGLSQEMPGMRRLIVNAYQIETKRTPPPFIMQHHVTRILNMIEYGNSWEIVRSVDLRTTWRVAPFPCAKEAIAGFVGLGRYIDVTAVPSRHFFHVLLSCTRTNKVLVLCVSVCQMINQNQ